MSSGATTSGGSMTSSGSTAPQGARASGNATSPDQGPGRSGGSAHPGGPAAGSARRGAAEPGSTTLGADRGPAHQSAADQGLADQGVPRPAGGGARRSAAAGAGTDGPVGAGAGSPERVWSVADHLDDILGRVVPLEPIELPLLDAHNCVLVEDVVVPAPLPPFDNSSMDGYAVRVADVAAASESSPAVLTVIGDVAAGGAEPPTVGPGQAARIMTGAPVPPGAEAVVPVEWTDGGTGGGPADAMTAHSAAPERAGGEVRVHRPVDPGQYVRTAGSDVIEGTVALRAGTVLGPPQIGLLAAIGHGVVTVRPRPRVAVLSTGSELVPPGQPLAPGRIHDSNSFVLTSAARDAGAVAHRAGAVADDSASLRSALEDQLASADLVITSGGVSVGAYDVVKEALSTGPDGDGVAFRRLAMQPGKPQGFGLLGPARIPLLALPGNPVSAYVSFELFVRPVIRTLMGLWPVHRTTVRARLVADEPLTSPEGKRQFLRGSYADGEVRPVGGASSHLVAALAQANALIVVEEDTVTVPPGTELDVVPLTGP